MKVNIIIFSLLLLNLFILSKCQEFNETTNKAFSCMSVINQKFKGGNQDSNLYSPVMLSCFSKITREQTNRVLESLRGEENFLGDPLEPEEIDELTNTDILKNMTKDEIKKLTKELEKGFKEFEQMDKDMNEMREGRGSDEEYDENNNDNNDSERKKKMLIIVFMLVNLFGFAFYFLVIDKPNTPDNYQKVSTEEDKNDKKDDIQKPKKD